MKQQGRGGGWMETLCAMSHEHQGSALLLHKLHRVQFSKCYILNIYRYKTKQVYRNQDRKFRFIPNEQARGNHGKETFPELTQGRNIKREQDSKRENTLFWVTPESASMSCSFGLFMKPATLCSICSAISVRYCLQPQ